MFEVIISAYRWFFLKLAGLVGLGWGIVLLSVICSVLMLPLMRLVVGIVKGESDYQSVILPQLADIKLRYASDVERHLHIQRLYRRYGYSPLSAVKKVLPLFVQIPFLLLTYFMLKDTVELRGVPFFFLNDLGRPDALLTTFNVNLLPIVMTGINILTVFATPGFTSRDWIQAIGISVLFLVLLYTASSALLLYWTLNNAITFLRTIVAHNAEGMYLFLSRLKSLKNMPTLIHNAMTPKVLAYMSFLLFLLALYFCGTAKLMIRVNGGITCKIMYRGMFFVLATASIIQFLHLKNDCCVRKFFLCTSIFTCVGFSLLLAGTFIFSRTMFMRFLEWGDLFIVFIVLSVIWMMPYLLIKAPFRIRVWLATLVSNGWILCFPVILAIHYSYASEVFILPFSSLLILCIYMVIPCVMSTLLLTLMFNRWISVTHLFRLTVGVFIGIYLIPLFSTEVGFLAYNRNLIVRLAVISAVAIILYFCNSRKTGVVFQALLFITVVINAAISHGGGSGTPKAGASGSWRMRLESVMGDAHCVKSNNVYLLVYDSYGHRSILDALGLQDDEVYEKLKSHGYTIYDAYSTGADTLTSMSEMFTFAGVKGEDLQSTISGDNVFCDLLRASGYHTSYILLGYVLPTKGVRKPGDYYFPGESKITRPEMVLFPCILRGTLSQSPSVFDSYSKQEWLAEKHRVLTQCALDHSFVYAHMEYPEHAPWYPRFRKSDQEEQIMYRERLKKANEEMEKDLNLLDGDPNAIVILMSDHGGSLILPDRVGHYGVKNLIDHFGIFLAIRWPQDYSPTLELNCLQNVLIEVSIYLTGDKSLRRLENPGITTSLDYPLGIDAGAIKNGIIQFGEGEGRNLFDEAKRAF